MKPRRDPQRDAPTIDELYPQLSPDEWREAQENLRRYGALVARVARRLQHDPDGVAALAKLMDERDAAAAMRSELPPAGDNMWATDGA
jgi:hypothetical protein